MAGPRGPSMDNSRDSIDNTVDSLPEMEAPAGNTGAGRAPMNLEAVNRVMFSDIGINVLLNRLKQSIASAKEFSSFLSKRARLEDEHAQGLKKLARATGEGVRRQDGRQGSYASQFSSVCGAQDRMADHGVQFANSLHQMHLDIETLTNRIERDRKHWKQEGTNNEKKVKDAEAALEKSKARYDSLAEDYDRARTGGGASGRVFTVKGPKSAEKHEEDLNRKVQAADSDYMAKVQAAKSARQENLSSSRPQAVATIQELIRECDSAMALQLQKFAAFNEKLIVGNGLEVSPLRGESDPSRTSSMREMVQQIDNDRDFHNYIMGHANNVPGEPAEIAYQQHPTLARGGGGGGLAPQSFQTPSANKRSSFQQTPPTKQTPTFDTADTPEQASPYASRGPQSQQIPTQSGMQMRTQSPSRGVPYQTASPPSAVQPGPAILPQARQQFSGPERGYPSSGSQSAFQPSPAPPVAAPNGSYASSGSYPQRGPPSDGPGQGPPFSQGPTNGNYGPSSQMPQQRAPTQPVFGVSLEDLFARDETPIPLIVHKCVQAVDLFGLDVEGIYRLSGNAAHINQLKGIFNSNPHDAPNFGDPASFHHDVNSVAGLLKQFFRELPDPLLTAEGYSRFMEAARVDDDDIRRDSVHAVINGLPDPNYATLRHVVLHLDRVMQHAERNRMGCHNLAICFAPTLMGQHTGPQMADAGLQARVLDTILRNTFQIFDED